MELNNLFSSLMFISASSSVAHVQTFVLNVIYYFSFLPARVAANSKKSCLCFRSLPFGTVVFISNKESMPFVIYIQ